MPVASASAPPDRWIAAAKTGWVLGHVLGDPEIARAEGHGRVLFSGVTTMVFAVTG